MKQRAWMSNWEYGGVYKKYNMDGIINLPNNSKLMECDFTKNLPEFMKDADTLFIDPPWNIGNVNSFYTKADINHVHFDFIKFSDYLFAAIEKINPKYLFIEMGKEFISVYLEWCKKKYKYVTFYNSTYYHKKSNKCYVIHATNIFKNRRYKILEDMDEENIIEWICRDHEYKCIGDLCMGTGLVGKNAFINNKRFVGIDINRKRLALLVDYIRSIDKNP